MKTTDSRDSPARADHSPGQLALGIAAVLLAAGLAYGAANIPSDAGYAGVGPDFLPWVVSAAMGLCGVLLIWEVRTGGFRNMPEPSGAARGDWHAMVWVSAGILGNAALITTIGFILSCAMCFTLAVRGLRISEGKPAGNAMQTVKDAVIGMLISAPTFWLFTKFLAVNLPGLTGTGWL
ncbi:MAG: tripartite tricarboxylate transporter TctB [Betaproteobacteria bacterium HGW-Betaproteobacteria-9]|jgi:putative tricarboxylic transport membrane protein|nr:MAG: tripartite tricarboxylate transporter TctB [Betaproteobacteria bacterium HGW-Betaproteobacteria-9]